MSETLVLDLPGAPDPETALDRLIGLEGRVLLRSAGEGGAFSFLAASPLETITIHVGEDPFLRLEKFLTQWKGSTPRSSKNHPFAGGVVGFLSYEAGDVLERLPESQADDIGVPLAWFAAYEFGALWDARTGRCRVLATLLAGRSDTEVRREMEQFANRILTPAVKGGDRSGVRTRGNSQPVSSLSRSDFMAGVQRIREYILAGDLFQANLTRRISAPTSLAGTDLFHRLLRESPAPYSAYLDCGDLEIASISPELFLSLRGSEVRTSPIKGTAPRGSTPEEDQVMRDGLGESEKNRAENIMIVDLLRNDLSKVSLPGTIAVPRLAEVETHPTVHHLVSTVTGTLAPEVGIVDLLRATFPGGSITGAPKIRAMEILRELEPVQRGVYTGAIGVVGFGGDSAFSVAIRTATLRHGVAHYGTGGGITLASTSEEEWIETEEKAKAFLRAMAVE
jgi:para-aminobenzoate synthetase component 1